MAVLTMAVWGLVVEVHQGEEGGGSRKYVNLSSMEGLWLPLSMVDIALVIMGIVTPR